LPPAPATISRGKTDTVYVQVTNPSPSSVDITAANLNFVPGVGGSYVVAPSPDLPLTIGSLSAGVLRFVVTVNSGSATGVDYIDASITGNIGGTPVSDGSLLPLTLPSWTVVTAAQVSYVATSLNPTTVSQGQPYSLKVGLENSGGATLTLNADSTTVSFTDGVDVFTAKLSQSIGLAPATSQTVTFQSMTVPLAMDIGSYDVELYVSGTENGGPFQKTLNTGSAGDQITVVAPASINPSGTPLNPSQVSQNSMIGFEVNLVNSGGGTVILNPLSTTLSFGGFSQQLDPNGALTIPGGPHTILFRSAVVSDAPGTYSPSVHLEGTENGLPFSTNIALTNALVVENAPDIDITSIVTSKTRITQDKTAGLKVTVTVANNGDATVSFTQASISFFLGAANRTSDFVITPAHPGFFNSPNLAGGGVDQALHIVVALGPPGAAIGCNRRGIGEHDF